MFQFWSFLDVKYLSDHDNTQPKTSHSQELQWLTVTVYLRREQSKIS